MDARRQYTTEPPRCLRGVEVEAGACQSGVLASVVTPAPWAGAEFVKFVQFVAGPTCVAPTTLASTFHAYGRVSDPPLPSMGCGEQWGRRGAACRARTSPPRTPETSEILEISEAF